MKRHFLINQRQLYFLFITFFMCSGTTTNYTQLYFIIKKHLNDIILEILEGLCTVEVLVCTQITLGNYVRIITNLYSRKINLKKTRFTDVFKTFP